jgi:hypothetical protein
MLILVFAAAGCASRAPAPALDLTQERALALFSRAAPASLEGKGRLGVRTPDGQSAFSFRLAYDGASGLRVDLTWKAFVGLVRRDGSVLVRGDSVWLDLPDDAGPDEAVFGRPTRIELLGGLAPDELILALVGAAGDLEERRGELVAFRSEPRAEGYVLTFERGDRVESLTIRASTGDLRARELYDRGRGRRLHVLYDRFAAVDGSRRPAVVDVRDSESRARIRFVFSEQAVGRAHDPARFAPPAGARLLGCARPGGRPSLTARGTSAPLGGS